MSSTRTDGRALAALLWPHLRPRLGRYTLALGLGLVLAALSAAQPGLRVRALVLSGRGTERELEETRALTAFGTIMRLVPLFCLPA